ncbi:MAG TPA: M23 family metallopeptidase [Actinomycetes bacterium]|nr:M23 family metallopeptidase [Actinomycetes bacterium]
MRTTSRTLLAALLTVALTVLGGGPTWADATAPVPPGPDRWAAPVQPLRLARGFAPPAQRWLPGHRGIDLAASVGAEVRAVDAGVVVWAGDLAGIAVVSIAHPNGLRSTYQPVEASVEIGDLVARGQPLGTVTVAGSHCAPAACLHLGAKRGQTYLDPSLLLGLRRPRLLPYLTLDPTGATGVAPTAPDTPVTPAASPGLVDAVSDVLASMLAALGQAALT